MKIPISLLLCLSAASVSALDLTPAFILTEADGVSIRRPYFADGDKKYAVTLDSETELTPYEDGALFRFIRFDHAEMRLRPSSFSAEIKFGPETLAAYQEAARKLLPQVAEGIVLEKEAAGLLPINGWTSHRFTFKYTTPAGPVRESITFLNILPTQQVIVQVYAMDKNFEDACGRADDIIRRWHQLDPKMVLRGN